MQITSKEKGSRNVHDFGVYVPLGLLGHHSWLKKLRHELGDHKELIITETRKTKYANSSKVSMVYLYYARSVVVH
jgi:hypothetical protein